MKRFGAWMLAGVVALATGCQKEDDAVLKKLDEMDDRLASIEEKIGEGGSAGARARGRRERPKPKRADPSKVYSVPVGDSPSEGPETAKVTIVEAFEFACPYCHRVHPTIQKLKEQYGQDLRVVYKNFVVHPGSATTPALASCAAHKQGKYSQMVDMIWKKGYENNRNLSEDNMKKIAQDVGLDMSKFESDMKSQDCKSQLKEDQQLLRKVGTRGTPNFYINGRPLSGAQPIGKFKSVIDEELEKAKKRIAKGTSASEYYKKWVVEKGEKKL